MSATSSIEWTDRTWNPVRGCSVISPGCVNCYAMKFAHRFSAEGKPYAGLTKQTKAGPQWTGLIRTVEDALLEPLSWRKPQRVFVNSMSDLFHEDVSFEFIDKVFAVMAARTVHTFQILTKRADRMRAYMTDPLRHATIADAWTRVVPRRANRPTIPAWPFQHVWLGVSVEDQKHADLRIPDLIQTPAAVRFISAEPLLGPVDFSDVSGRVDAVAALGRPAFACIDWVIVGGESGPGARPFDIAWARSIVRQCQAAEVPVFVKQIGSVPVMNESEWRALPLTPILNHRNRKHAPDGSGIVPLLTGSKKGGDPSEWPEDLRVRQFPEAVHA